MNKTWLIAARDYVENLRTKTFWIGILSVPILLVGTFAVTFLLQDAADVRNYTVIDMSQGQWLSKEIERRTQLGDLEHIRTQMNELPEESLAPETIRANLRAQAEKDPQGHPLRSFRELLLTFSDDDLVKITSGASPSGEAMSKLITWYMGTRGSEDLSKAIDKAFSNLRMADYQRIQFDDLGTDPQAALNQKLQEDEIFAYFIIGEDPIASGEGCLYVSNNLTDSALKDWYSGKATEIVREKRIAEMNLTAQQANRIMTGFRFSSRKVSAVTGKAEEIETKETISQFAPIAFVYLLWIAVFTAAQMLLTNSIEEKSNRIIEVLLSSVSPLQLMTGKIIGIGATGLTIVGSWVAFAIIALQVTPYFTNLPISELGLLEIISDPLYLISFIGYFLGGYLFYAAILVGFGSVCNSLKEAQNLMQPVIVLLIIPLLTMIPVVNDPNGTLARVLTYIPPFTPFLMMNRPRWARFSNLR